MRMIEARIAKRRRELADALPGVFAPPAPAEEPGTDPAITAPDPEGAPPRLAAIADVEPVEAPYAPPPGASRNARPVWTSDGEHTGQLVIADAPADAPVVAPTLEIALPAAPPAIPPTRELALPEARAGEATAVLPEPQPTHADEPTAVLPEPLAPSPKPVRRGYEPTAVLTEAQLRGEAPVPMRGRSIYEEVTSVLPASLLEENDDSTQVVPADALAALDDDDP